MLLEALRAVAGFVLVLFVPGYAATWALFPDRKEIDAIERIALSIGLSIALVVLTVYILNVVVGVPITTTSALLIVLGIILVCSLAANYRMKRMPGCPVCKSNVVTRYDSHYECDSCGKQWTRVD